MLFHLVADVARRKKRRFSVLFIDWEAQYQCTIAHILKMREMYRDVTETFTGWHSPDYGKRCLSVSAGMDMLGTGVEWVRQPPDDAITDMSYFPFYRYAMTFEEFVPAFSSGLPVTGVEWQY